MKACVSLETFDTVPSLECIKRLAVGAVEALPRKFRNVAQKIAICVDNYPQSEVLLKLKIANKYELLGLYRGVPLSYKRRPSPYSRQSIDTIFLYRCPLYRYSVDNCRELKDLVEHVMMHEMGHHFGFLDHEWTLGERDSF